MKNYLFYLLLSFYAIFSPIQLTIIMLMCFMFLDTIVKVVSIKYQTKTTGDEFYDVFKSRVCRGKFIIKGFGYGILVLPIFFLDIHILTPFTEWLVREIFNLTFTIPNKAIYANLLIIIFCIIEIASINETWYKVSNKNLLRIVFVILQKTKKAIEKIVDFFEIFTKLKR